jgi:hypothetical protein
MTGVVVSADETQMLVRLDDSDETRAVAYEVIDRAHTVFDWSAALREKKSSVNAEEVVAS